jgi:hypothetical protein
LWNPVQHFELMAVDIGMIFFGPAIIHAAIQTSLGSAAVISREESSTRDSGTKTRRGQATRPVPSSLHSGTFKSAF